MKHGKEENFEWRHRQQKYLKYSFKSVINLTVYSAKQNEWIAMFCDGKAKQQGEKKYYIFYTIFILNNWFETQWEWEKRREYKKICEIIII